MTAPFEVEIEDDDKVIPIENSHLSRGRCGCGQTALFAPGRRPRCGACIRRDADVAPAPVFSAEILPPLGQGHPPAPSAGRSDYPAPEISSRDSWDGSDAPGPVVKLADRAHRAGWRARVQRSRGCPPHGSTGVPTAVRTLYMVVLGNGRYSAYAAHDGGKWASVMLWGHDRTWFSLANFTELEQYVTAAGEMDDAWYAGVRRRVTEAAQRAEERKGCDKGLHLAKHLTSSPFLGPFRGNTAGWRCSLCKHSWLTGSEVWKKPKTGRTEAL